MKYKRLKYKKLNNKKLEYKKLKLNMALLRTMAMYASVTMCGAMFVTGCGSEAADADSGSGIGTPIVAPIEDEADTTGSDQIVDSGGGSSDDASNSIGSNIYEPGDEGYTNEFAEGNDETADSGELPEGVVGSAIVDDGVTESSDSDVADAAGDSAGDGDEAITDGTITNKEEQLAVISSCYEECKEAYFEEIGGQAPKFTIADLNHNGRLELIFSDCQGTGAFSYTRFYEVSEDYTYLSEISTSDNDNIDTLGDFLTYDVLTCYEKDGIYYYIVEDYSSSGWDYRGTQFYMYSLDGCVEYTGMGGFVLEGTMNENNECVYHVKMYDSAGKICAGEEDYLADKNSFLMEYNKKSSCKIVWMSMTDGRPLLEKIQASYAGFDPEYGNSEVDFSYTKIYGENANYIISYR